MTIACAMILLPTTFAITSFNAYHPGAAGNHMRWVGGALTR